MLSDYSETVDKRMILPLTVIERTDRRRRE
jgi:hypothetical protein